MSDHSMTDTDDFEVITGGEDTPTDTDLPIRSKSATSTSVPATTHSTQMEVEDLSSIDADNNTDTQQQVPDETLQERIARLKLQATSNFPKLGILLPADITARDYADSWPWPTVYFRFRFRILEVLTTRSSEWRINSAKASSRSTSTRSTRVCLANSI
jgi:hypothetical protein